MSDWAIVAGLSSYPELGNLDGPENDARAFRDWLVHKAGVPEGQVKMVLSSSFKPAATRALDANPTPQAIEHLIDELCVVAEENSQKGQGLKVGRRLYMFLAGHGCTPAGDEAALLTANATRSRVYHLPPRPYANWFIRSGYFEEVVLLMDCCRERYPQVALRVLPYVDLTDLSAVDRSKVLYGFATKWGRLSREKKMADGKVRGIFSTALLAGLNGAAADAGGEITARSLADFLYNHMKKLLTPEELADEDVPKEPELIYDTNPNARFVILKLGAGAGASGFPVRVKLRAEDAGKEIEILDSRFKKVASTKAKGTGWELELPKGMYLCQILASGRQQPFEVSGVEGGAHVVKL